MEEDINLYVRCEADMEMCKGIRTARYSISSYSIGMSGPAAVSPNICIMLIKNVDLYISDYIAVNIKFRRLKGLKIDGGIVDSPQKLEQ